MRSQSWKTRCKAAFEAYSALLLRQGWKPDASTNTGSVWGDLRAMGPVPKGWDHDDFNEELFRHGCKYDFASALFVSDLISRRRSESLFYNLIARRASSRISPSWTDTRTRNVRRAWPDFTMLSGDEAGIIFTQLCNTLDPRVAMAFSSTSPELWALTQALRQQLRADYKAAAALCRKVGQVGSARSCAELREAYSATWYDKGLSAADLTALGKLGSVLPALLMVTICELSGAASPDGVQRLAENLGAGALPAVVKLALSNMPVGCAGASALAAALGRGALPRLKCLALDTVNISDAGLVALAPALRRLPALDQLYLKGNPIGDEGLAALVPQLPTGDLLPPTGKLAKLAVLDLESTQLSDAGCAALAAAITSGALPLLDDLELGPGGIPGIPASAAAIGAVHAALRDYDSQRRFESMYL